MKAATMIGVRLDWHILELLDKLTVRLGVNRSAVIVLAIRRLAEAQGIYV